MSDEEAEEAREGLVQEKGFFILPSELFCNVVKKCDKEELVGGTPEENAQITKDILSGKITDGKRTAVILNAGAALHITNRISLEEGFALAADILANGSGLKKLEDFIAATNA